MRLAIISFTERGGRLGRLLGQSFRENGHEADSCEKRSGTAGESLREWTSRAFAAYDGLIFVGACGIAVRAIAPFLKDKFTDPAVVVLDEGANFAVSLLSGHVGGANELCRLAAAFSGAVPVISTATDVNGLFAVDVFAKKNQLVLKDRRLAKLVSARLLSGARIPFYSTRPLADQAPGELAVFERAEEFLREPGLKIAVSERILAEERTLEGRPSETDGILYLVPRSVTVGMGCRRGAGKEALSEALDRVFSDAGIFPEALAGVATIERKKDEEGLILLTKSRKVPFLWYKAEELLDVPGEFSCSDFVEKTVGVDCVCERAAVLGSGGGSLLLRKQAADGVTLAAARGEKPLRFGREKE